MAPLLDAEDTSDLRDSYLKCLLDLAEAARAGQSYEAAFQDLGDGFMFLVDSLMESMEVLGEVWLLTRPQTALGSRLPKDVLRDVRDVLERYKAKHVSMCEDVGTNSAEVLPASEQ